MAAFYPLDTLRSRLQVDNDLKMKGSSWELLVRLANEEGIEALYRGLSPVLQSVSVSNFVYFYCFHALRRLHTTEVTAVKDLLVGSVAGVINVLLTSPLWTVNMRMKVEKNKYDSLIKGLIEISKKEGAKGLWSGVLPSLLLVSNPAIQFMVYEYLKRHVIARGKFNAYSGFLIAAVAKAVATSLTYPLQLVQSRLRAGTSLKPLWRDVKSKPSVMFRGLEAKLLQTVMTAALMFFIYERLVRLVLLIMRVQSQRK
ncbi:peroxisomal membrane protein PMP34-like isoform X2 [Achroia grisella]|nr:peroxisomal membrane protein PMP34-like isoform X2 [Achroia grisella]XP_059054134.1 peroxisomal membrane protein PMP34-like isoform X2 [Achroia grisella]XP_059054135.1 peroxisomal membrane protein PMP34-like isoform X2 [Achroia grisella]